MRLLPLFFLFPFAAIAQDDKKVMETINFLFEGMKKSDSAIVHKTFHTTARLTSVSLDAKTSQPVLKEGQVSGFLKSIGTPHSEVYNELIWSPKIDIDGNFAQAWAPYVFYLGKTFSHCGVDAFQLFKDSSGVWKIFNLADTRQKEGCHVPKEISDRMK